MKAISLLFLAIFSFFWVCYPDEENTRVKFGLLAFPEDTWVRYDMSKIVDNRQKDVTYFHLLSSDGKGGLEQWTSLNAEKDSGKPKKLDGIEINLVKDFVNYDQLMELKLQKSAVGECDIQLTDGSTHVEYYKYAGVSRGWRIDIDIWLSPNKRYPFRAIPYPLGELSIPVNAIKISISMSSDDDYFHVNDAVLNENKLFKCADKNVICIEEYIEFVRRSSNKIVMIGSEAKLSSLEIPDGLAQSKTSGILNGSFVSKSVEAIRWSIGKGN